MTINQAIERADALKPNAYTTTDKIVWLGELDGRVMSEIHAAHDMAQRPFSHYDAQTNENTELIVPEPYSEIYIYWLFTKIDFMNAETARFNNSAIMFNTCWMNYSNYINRTHAPRQPNSLARI